MLCPLVQVLKTAWSDALLLFFYKSTQTPKRFRLALLCVGCDIPASRELCGFLGHVATMGCNKCKKEFPVMLGEKFMVDLTDQIGQTETMQIIEKNVK